MTIAVVYSLAIQRRRSPFHVLAAAFLTLGPPNYSVFQIALLRRLSFLFIGDGIAAMIGAEELKYLSPTAINAAVNLCVDELFRRHIRSFCRCLHCRESGWGELSVSNRVP